MGKNHSSSVIVSEINLIFLQFEDSVSKSKHKFYFNAEMLKEFSFIYEIKKTFQELTGKTSNLTGK